MSLDGWRNPVVNRVLFISRIGRVPASLSVVDPQGEYHHVKSLFVADGSLFPTSIGGPPRIPIYTFGRRVVRCIRASL
ncbi:MAG: GMC oxidoreductase [Bradymonadaceae bacterium]